MFRIGQKVCCVAGPLIDNGNDVQPIIGQIYTIRHIYHTGEDEPYDLAFLLSELRCDLHCSGNEFGFYASRFHPIVERKTDISIFTKMLTPELVP